MKVKKAFNKKPKLLKKPKPLNPKPDRKKNYNWAENSDWTNGHGVTVMQKSKTMDEYEEFDKIIQAHDVVLNSANTNLITAGVSGIAEFCMKKYPDAIDKSEASRWNKKVKRGPGNAVLHTLTSRKGYKKLVVHAVCMRKRKANKDQIQVENPERIGQYVVASVYKATKKAFRAGGRTIVGKTMASRWTYSNVLSGKKDCTTENQKIRNYIFLGKMIQGFKRAKADLKKAGKKVDNLHLTIYQARKK